MRLEILHHLVHFFIHNNGLWGLFILSFLETSFLPIPSDILLIIMGLLNPDHVLGYSIVATLGAALGGIVVYWIGIASRMPLLMRWVSDARRKKMEKLIDKYGGWALIMAGFTPIGYIAGMFKLNWLVFITTFTIGRGIKYFAEGLAIILLGDRAVELVKHHYHELTFIISVIIAITVILLYFLVRYFKNRKNKVA